MNQNFSIEKSCLNFEKHGWISEQLSVQFFSHHAKTHSRIAGKLQSLNLQLLMVVSFCRR